MLTQQLCYSLNLHMGYIFLVHFVYSSFIGTAWHIDFLHILFLIQCLFILLQVSVLSVMNFRSVDVQKNCIIAIVVFVVINYHCILVM